MKVALITGADGQDAAHLAELSLEKRYVNTDRIDHLDMDLDAEDLSPELYHRGMRASTNLICIVKKTQPDEMAFAEMRVEIEFIDEGVNERGFVKSIANLEYNAKIGQKVIAVDSLYFRSAEADLLTCNPTKSKTKLGWKPAWKEMVARDAEIFKKENKTQREYLAG